jgi:hypothetical protein
MNEHILLIQNHLKEIADECELTFSSNVMDTDKDIMFVYVSTRCLTTSRAGFVLMFDFHENVFHNAALSKRWELKDYESVFRLLCELVS